MEMIGSMNPFIQKIYYFTVELEEQEYTNTNPPKFLSSLKSLIIVALGQEVKYELPKIKDPDDDPYYLEIFDNTISSILNETLPDYIFFD